MSSVQMMTTLCEELVLCDPVACSPGRAPQGEVGGPQLHGHPSRVAPTHTEGEERNHPRIPNTLCQSQQ